MVNQKAKELLKLLKTIKPGTVKYLIGYDATGIFLDGYYGVAINIDNTSIIDEKFNRAEVVNLELVVRNVKSNVVCLRIKEQFMDEMFGILCLSFLDESNRDIVKDKPLVWFEQWQNILGNKKVKKRVYDVLGEMRVLLYLLEQNKNPMWNSIEKGTFDITADDAIYEVKTTQERVGSIVTIHNQYQLDVSELSKPLYIAFVRVERNDAGTSIDELYSKIIGLGYDKYQIDKYLTDIGYYENKKERYEKYLIHSIRLFEVNDDFPVINNESFINKKIPDGVIKLEYSISLDGLNNIKIL